MVHSTLAWRIPWTAAHQAPPSMGFSRQEYCVPWGYSISEVVVRVKWEMAHSHYSINVAYLYAWNIVLRLTINNSKLLQPFSINCPVFKNDSCALSLNFSNFCLPELPFSRENTFLLFEVVGHDWATSLSLFTFMHWRRKWQPTPMFLPRESQGQGSLVGCRLWGRTESDTTEVT